MVLIAYPPPTTLSIKNLREVPFDDQSSLNTLGCPSLKLTIVDEHLIFPEQLEQLHKQLSEPPTIGGHATMLISRDVLQKPQAKRIDSLDCLTKPCLVSPET
jgi:hypothetical protein